MFFLKKTHTKGKQLLYYVLWREYDNVQVRYRCRDGLEKVFGKYIVSNRTGDIDHGVDVEGDKEIVLNRRGSCYGHRFMFVKMVDWYD